MCHVTPKGLIFWYFPQPPECGKYQSTQRFPVLGLEWRYLLLSPRCSILEDVKLGNMKHEVALLGKVLLKLKAPGRCNFDFTPCNMEEGRNLGMWVVWWVVCYLCKYRYIISKFSKFGVGGCFFILFFIFEKSVILAYTPVNELAQSSEFPD